MHVTHTNILQTPCQHAAADTGCAAAPQAMYRGHEKKPFTKTVHFQLLLLLALGTNGGRHWFTPHGRGIEPTVFLTNNKTLIKYMGSGGGRDSKMQLHARGWQWLWRYNGPGRATSTVQQWKSICWMRRRSILSMSVDEWQWTGNGQANKTGWHNDGNKTTIKSTYLASL